MKFHCPVCKRSVDQCVTLPNDENRKNSDNRNMCIMCFLQSYMNLQEANRILMLETQTSLYIVDRSVELQNENRSLRRLKTAFKRLKEKIDKGDNHGL
jgi:hypothetical protein